MRHVVAIAAAGLVAGALVGPAWAQQQPAQSTDGYGSHPSEEVARLGIGPLFSAPMGTQHLLGDWGGAQPWLHEHGVDVMLGYLNEAAGNVSGGATTGVRQSGQAGLEIDLDGAKLLGWNGFSLHNVIVARHGRSLSADTLHDDLDAVQEIFGSGGNVVAKLVYLYGEQELARGRVDVAAGWLPVGTYFASSPLYCEFVNVIVCGNPHPLPVYPGEPDWPVATWGGQVRVLTTPRTYVMAGLFQVNPNNGGRSGWDVFHSGSTGISIPVEVGWVPQFGPNHLIGHYKFGFDEDTSDYDDLFSDSFGQPLALSGLNGAPRHGRKMFYVMPDQMLIRTGDGDTDGVILFGGWVHADADVSPLENQFFGGVESSATFLGRSQDSFGVAFSWFSVSNQLTRTQEIEQEFGLPLSGGGLGTPNGVQTHEQMLEVQYSANVYRGVTLQPDFQYVMRPGGTSTFPNAVVLGMRTTIAF